MKQLALAVALVVGSMLGVAADATVTGTWTMNVEGGPHGNATMGLVLKQEGTKVTGTFASGHSAEMEVAGQFKDGQLDVETKGGESRIIFSAKLKADGTLSGSISSEMGDMKWTASRQAEKQGGK
jgi:hypothetical protein